MLCMHLYIYTEHYTPLYINIYYYVCTVPFNNVIALFKLPWCMCGIVIHSIQESPYLGYINPDDNQLMTIYTNGQFAQYLPMANMMIENKHLFVFNAQSNTSSSEIMESQTLETNS